MSVWRTKSIEQSMKDTGDADDQLKRGLTWLDLIGVGVVIGAGIFTLTGKAAKEFAGPGIVLSFVLAGICCVAGIGFFRSANCHPFIPPAEGGVAAESTLSGALPEWIFGIEPHVCGILGVVTAASLVFFAMCRDHLLPQRLSAVHPRFDTRSASRS